MWAMYKETSVTSWHKGMNVRMWERYAQLCPEFEEQDSYVHQAVKIARKGIDTAFSERPGTKPKEPRMDIGDKIKVMKQLLVQVRSGFMAGPVILEEGQRLVIDSPTYGILETTYSPMFGIAKKGTEEIRLLLNQSSNDLEGGKALRPSVNSMIIDKYAEMGSMQEWCEFYEGAQWVAGNDIRKGFYRSRLSDRRAALSATMVCGFHFICVVGIMGAADTPRMIF